MSGTTQGARPSLQGRGLQFQAEGPSQAPLSPRRPHSRRDKPLGPFTHDDARRGHCSERQLPAFVRSSHHGLCSVSGRPQLRLKARS